MTSTPTPERLGAIARRMSRLAGIYKNAVAQLVAAQPDEPHSPAVAIVYRSCVPYITSGASALDAAAARIAEAAAIEVAPLIPAASPIVSSTVFADTAHILYEALQEAPELAEEVGDTRLTGDTHPYGDVIYGICLPYLLQAAEETS